MRRKPSIAFAVAALVAAGAGAVEPQLAAYVTDDDRDVYVALYGAVAVELAGCPSAAAARALLALKPDAALREETFGRLTGDFELGAHPRIPCGADAPFDADLAATTPIWADLADSGRYYLPGPQGGGVFYSIPAACGAIKAAFAIRQRITLPGVLQAQAPPPAAEMTVEHVLDCGSHAGGRVDGDLGDGGLSRFSLHRAVVFLSEMSAGDSIYVAVLSRTRGGEVEKAYLPIHRLDGRPAHELIWAGGATTEAAEAALFELFGVDPEDGISDLGGDGVARLDSQVFVDLCHEDCAGYRHQHAVFALPGVDFELSPLPAPAAEVEWDLLGEERIRWTYAEGRAATFAGCPALTAALGLEVAGGGADWAEAVDRAIAAEEVPAAAFTCKGAGPDLCVRRLGDGAALTASHVARGADCPAATRLRLELGATARLAQALVLGGSAAAPPGFDEVEIVPADPEGRSALTVTPSPLALGPSGCLFSDVHGLIGARGLERLTLRRIDLVRAAQEPAGPEVTALVVEGGTVALDAVSLGAAGEGRLPVERGLRLCNARAHVLGGRLQAEALAIRGMNSELALIGRPEAPAAVAAGSFGVFLMSGSRARLHLAELTAPTTVVLRGAEVEGSRTALASGASSPAGSALRLERGARAELLQSTARGFGCLGLFRDPDSSARFVLPGNDLAADNTRVSCGLSQVSILE